MAADLLSTCMRSVLAIAFLIILALPSCVVARVWSAKELGEWYASQIIQIANDPWSVRMGYLGSDAEYHYFVVRPIDSFVVPRIPRSELNLADVRPLRSVPDYYYLVDPSQEYRRVEAQPSGSAH